MKTIAVISGTMLALSAALGGCTSKPDVLPRSVVQAFETCFNADDLDACVGLFDDDAQVMPEQGPIVTGRENIAQYLQDQMTPVVSFNTEADMTLVRNDIAIEQGHFRVRDVRRGSDIEEGKYLHVWRNRNGNWKLYRVMYNTDVAPDTEVSVAQTPDEPTGG